MVIRISVMKDLTKNIEYAVFCLVYINNFARMLDFQFPAIKNTGNI